MWLGDEGCVPLLGPGVASPDAARLSYDLFAQEIMPMFQGHDQAPRGLALDGWFQLL